MVEMFNTNIELNEMPTNGYEAYSMIIVSLATEIKEKTEILTEMLNDDIRRQFIKKWQPEIATVNIHV